MSYGVYGVSLRSTWKLPLPRVDRSPRLATITLKPASAATFAKALESQPPADTALRIHHRLSDGSTYLRWMNQLEFLIRADGRTLLCRTLNADGPAALHTYLSLSLSFALINLGFEPLHSTTPVIDGGAVALLGDCGYGKSSLGASFLAAGFPLLTDDLLVLSPHNGTVLAHPGARRIKLMPNTARRIFGRHVRGMRLKRVTPKLIIPLQGERAQTMPVPLRAIYILTPPSKPVAAAGARIRNLTQAQACLALVRSTFNTVVTDADRLRRQFRQAAELAATIPIKSLSYPRSFELLSAVRDAVIADVRKLHQPPVQQLIGQI